MHWGQGDSLSNTAKNSWMCVCPHGLFPLHTAPDFSWIFPVPPARVLHSAHTLLPDKDLPIIPETGLSGENQPRVPNQFHSRFEDPCKGLACRQGEPHQDLSTGSPQCCGHMVSSEAFTQGLPPWSQPKPPFLWNPRPHVASSKTTKGNRNPWILTLSSRV